LLDAKWNALAVQAAIDAYLNALPDGAWPDWIIGGHDKRRIASRIGQRQARILAMLLFTLKGTPFFFAGDEIGMTDVPIPPESVQDVFEKLVPGYGLNRDPERSPMRWDGSRYGGFTSGHPWLPMGEDVSARNVLCLQQDERSIIWLYRRLIELRNKQAALTAGVYEPIRSRDNVLMFKRSYADTPYCPELQRDSAQVFARGPGTIANLDPS
jgi:alpha-glucosidase